MIKKLIPKGLKLRIKNTLINKFSFLNATRPYQLLTEHPSSENKFIAIVTGGSGVIGRAICFKLGAMGYKVYVGGSRASSVQVVVDEMTEAGLTAIGLPMNLTDESDIVSQIRSVGELEGQIDVLVNCAGGSAREKHAPIYNLSTDVIDNILGVNLRGTMLCVREASKFMIERMRGRIICVTSVIGTNGKANFSEYAAAKGGLIAFVKSVAMELGKFKVTVNCVSPGIVKRGVIDEDQAVGIRRTNFLEGIGVAEDISEMAGYLVSQKASFITGQNFIVDGGRSLGLKES